MVLLSNDPFWNHVDVLNCGGFKCKFCEQSFAPTTSISRIKWHFSGEKGHGVATCGSVPKRLQEEAIEAMRGGKKRRKGNVGSSYTNDAAISTSPPEQNNEAENWGGDIGSVEQKTGERTSLAEAGNHQENLAGDQMMHIDRNITNGRPVVDTQEIRLDVLRGIDQVGQVDIENTGWPDLASIAQFLEVNVENGTGGSVQPVASASYSAPLPCNIIHQTRGDSLPIGSTRVVGQAFEKNKNVIWSWLMNDEVSLIGIYGMGGVGKTTLVKHIYNQLPSTFCHVYWITASQDCNISRLQNLIAKYIGLDFSNEDDKLCRAAKLSEKLVRKQKWVFILDDLWNSFDLEMVGIPIQMKGCKLILTTRSLIVCHKMDCQEMIKVKPLSDDEAWSLFTEKFGHSNAPSLEVQEIAKSITKECDGLPLGITTMAGTMRGVVDICEWRNALRELQESEVRKDDMEPEVFKILKFSYNHLNDSVLQQCFLYCALFPEDYKIGRVELISYLIDEGIIEMMKSRQAQFDKGHTTLNKLENICLLERCHDSEDELAVQMHDLLRDMALQIQRQNSQVMVKVSQNLTELPELEEWNANLVRVSLMENEIDEIYWSHSQMCPNLSTLLLCSNEELRFITNSFFKHFHRIKVLDLSNTGIRLLPNSIFDLVTLNSLLLRYCRNLRCIPSVKKLRVLKRLDLKDTELENYPEDMEWLCNLRYLRVGGCDQKEFPIGILPKLSHLQVFIQDTAVRWAKGKEVACLRKLEILQCYFKSLSDLVEYVNSRDKTQSLISYCLYVGQWTPPEHYNLVDYSCINRIVALIRLRISRDRDIQVLFPHDMKKLVIWQCDDATSLCDISSSIKNAAELEVIEIRNCSDMKSLLSSSWFCSAPLEPLSSHSLFPHLRRLFCHSCSYMEKLFPLALLPNLVNLEEISVEYGNLEEIIATTDEVADMDEECGSNSYSITDFSLPKLRSLFLYDLPALKSISPAKLKCDSLQRISIRLCPTLKRMPFSLPLLDNGQPSAPPSLKEIIMEGRMWESMEWDQPNAKDVLLPFSRLH